MGHECRWQTRLVDRAVRMVHRWIGFGDAPDGTWPDVPILPLDAWSRAEVASETRLHHIVQHPR